MFIILFIFLVCFVISFLCSVLLILLARRFHIFIDSAFSYKPQRFHTRATPRAGGIGIFIAFIFSLCYLCFGNVGDLGVFERFGTIDSSPANATAIANSPASALKDSFSPPNLVIWLTCLSVMFLSGLVEDFSGRLSPKIRLIMQCLSAFMLCVLLEIVLFDLSLGFALPYLIGLFFTTFALVGVSNAINIIDGFNGLASGVCALVLIALGYVALMLGDYFIFYCSIVLLAGILGFFALNFPFGKIFLGDGGAYFLGFVIGILLVLFTQSHAEVSAFFGLALMIYPIWEVLFSIWRKRIKRKMSATKPDKVHLHMLIFKRLTHSNAITSLTLWLINLPFITLSVYFYDNTLALFAVCGVFIVFYMIIYAKLIHFKI